MVHLERHFYRLAKRNFDRELSLQAIGDLLVLYDDQSPDEVGACIDEFVENSGAKLDLLYTEYESHSRPELLFLHPPECLLILDRLAENQPRLVELWRQHYPYELLEETGSRLGTIAKLVQRFGCLAKLATYLAVSQPLSRRIR